jgi:hypothetical protein
VHDRKLFGISSVRFYALSWLAGDQRRSDHSAAMTKSGEMTINPVTTTAGLIAEFKPMALLAEPLCELGESDRRIGDRADETDRSFPALFRNRHRDAGFVNVKPDVQRLLHSPSNGQSAAN